MSEIVATGSVAYALGWRAFKANHSHVPPVGLKGNEQTQFLRGYRDAKRIFNEPDKSDRSADMAKARKPKRKRGVTRRTPNMTAASTRKLRRAKAKFEATAKKLRADAKRLRTELRRCRKALSAPIPRKRAMPKMRVSDFARILGIKRKSEPRTKRKTSTQPHKKHRHNLA